MSGFANEREVLDLLHAAGLLINKGFDLGYRKQRWRVEGMGTDTPGWTCLDVIHLQSGHAVLTGHYGIWHGTDPGTQRIPRYQPDDTRPPLTAADLAALSAARKAADAKRLAAEKAEAARAAGWAAAVWHQAQPAPADHPYLVKKRIAPHTALALTDLDSLHLPDLDEANTGRLHRLPGALLIPLHDATGAIQGLQAIDATGRKLFWPTGMAMGANFGLLGPLPRAGIVLLCEGFATAATLREGTGLPCAYAFSANNLSKAAKSLIKAGPNLKILVCGDDDYLTDGNPGRCAAIQAANAAGGAWTLPDFTDAQGQDRRGGQKLTDFNDLATLDGTTLPLARQINATLDALSWRGGTANGAGVLPQGGGDGGGLAAIPSQLTIEEAVRRYWNTYGLGGEALFDEVERRIVHKKDVLNILPPRAWNELKCHELWRTARDTEIGFDPTESDPAIRCNLFGGWPTEPKQGTCDALLGLLEHLCSNESNQDELYHWMLCWLAYPLQHRGAKMHTAPVFHGPQGTGKSRFFEAYGQIFGDYFRVLGQEAIEDKFNADWAEKKLFILADEVLARQDMYHIKNRLKGFITGDRIRVNPKNVAAHTERNHMNIVFLSNEIMPLVLEMDDRRHAVIYVPPKLSADYFAHVTAEIDNGGIPALHWYLLHYDLGDFKPWTPPPNTKAKRDLQGISSSSELRFLQEWLALELDGTDGRPLPVCPCLGSHLYRVYEVWCERNGERKRAAKDFISAAGKRHGWRAGESCATWLDFNDRSEKSIKKRKMIIPSPADFATAMQRDRGDPYGERRTVIPQPSGKTLTEWLTDGYFEFALRAGLAE